MRSTYVNIITLVVTLALSTLAVYASLCCTVSNPTISAIQPYDRSLIYKTNDNVDKEDLFLAILGTDEREKENSRSDVLMLLKYNSKENKVIVVSVPRDSKIVIPGKGLHKINAAYAFGGAKLQVSILEDLFKVKNVRYIHLNFEGFKQIVAALGGIKINAAKDFRKEGSENIFAKKGESILMGDDLLDYVRFRHDADGDFGRIKRQQEVLSSLYSTVLSSENIAKLPKIISLVSGNFDSDMNIFVMMNHLKYLKTDSLEFEFYTLNTSSEKSNGIWYEIIDQDDLKRISSLLQN